jgi:DNA-binding response OmpR family regulator
LIDEDSMVRQSLGQALIIENFRVVSAKNQQEAVSKFQDQPLGQRIDIVLLDLNPRDESAWDTIQHLTALQPDLPVVAMSARLEQHDSRIGAPMLHALMEKPLKLHLLMKILNDLTLRLHEPPRLSVSMDGVINAKQSSHYE